MGDEDETPLGDVAAPPPGWYEDPDAPGKKRWWTGTDWGPDAGVEKKRKSPLAGLPILPIALFAVGFMLTAMSLILLFGHLSYDGRDCGTALTSPQIQTENGGPEYYAYHVSMCNEAKQKRGIICAVMALSGLALIGGSFLVDRKAGKSQEGSDDDAPEGDPGEPDEAAEATAESATT